MWPPARLLCCWLNACRRRRRRSAWTNATPKRWGSLCRQLDGIPLALELAAARVPLLGVDGVLLRLGEQMQLLSPARGTRRHASRRCEQLCNGATHCSTTRRRRSSVALRCSPTASPLKPPSRFVHLRLTTPGRYWTHCMRWWTSRSSAPCRQPTAVNDGCDDRDRARVRSRAPQRSRRTRRDTSAACGCGTRDL